MDIKDIEKTYERMTNDELIKITTKDAQGLRPEVFGIIEHEIKKRNLNPGLLNAAFAQNKDYKLEEVETYAEFLRALPCPDCGNTKDKLNGTICHTVKSFIFFTTYGTKPVIACPDCLNKANNSATLSTALLGWWGFPWGLLKTPLYIYRNQKAKKQNEVYPANETMLGFTMSNIGHIEAYRNDKEKLKEVLWSARP